MPEFDNKNRGVLFVNDKGDNPARPDFQGNVTIGDGPTHRISAWRKTDRNGKPYISIAVGDVVDG